MNRRRFAGWVLVAIGVLTIYGSMTFYTFYTPSLNQADMDRQGLFSVLVILLGSLLVIFGWLLLRKKEGGLASPRKSP